MCRNISKLMLQSLKIIPAAFICIAFLFRLLFVNIGFISLSAKQIGFAKSHVSSALKKKNQPEVDTAAGNYGYSVQEICEEGSNEDSSSKSKPFQFIQILYSFFSGNIDATLEKITPFYTYCSYTPSHRYLTFQVFRI